MPKRDAEATYLMEEWRKLSASFKSALVHVSRPQTGDRSSMRCCRVFRIAKEIGRKNEDAFACHRLAARFVLSDGASTSFAGRAWARALCKQYMLDPDVCPDWLSAARTRFADSIKVDKEDLVGSLALERGSFATFLGFTVLADRLVGVALGDSVLFVLTRSQCVRWIPPLHPVDFQSDPILLSSHPGRGLFDDSEESFAKSRFEVELSDPDQDGRAFVATTDAVAAWIVGNGEIAGVCQRIYEICQATNHGRFRSFIDAQRDVGAMRRDDCTMLVIQ